MDQQERDAAIGAGQRAIVDADRIGRDVAAAVLLFGGMLVLALAVSPWFWIGVGVFAAAALSYPVTRMRTLRSPRVRRQHPRSGIRHRHP